MEEIEYAYRRGIYPFAGEGALTSTTATAHTVGDHRHLVFTASGSLTVAQAIDFQVIAVGGGGGCGGGYAVYTGDNPLSPFEPRGTLQRRTQGGGGGGGAVRARVYHNVSSGTTGNVTVGTGGAVADGVIRRGAGRDRSDPSSPSYGRTHTYGQGGDGVASVFAVTGSTTLTAHGGGGGGSVGTGIVDASRDGSILTQLYYGRLAVGRVGTGPGAGAGGSGWAAQRGDSWVVATLGTSWIAAAAATTDGYAGGRGMRGSMNRPGHSNSHLREQVLCSGGGGGAGSAGADGWLPAPEPEMNYGRGGGGKALQITSTTATEVGAGGFGGRTRVVDFPAESDARTQTYGGGGNPGTGNDSAAVAGQAGAAGVVVIRYNPSGGPLMPLTV